MTVIIGGESRYYNAATANSTSKLFYQAEAFTPLGTSTLTAGASGASGAGSNVVRNTDLTTTYQAVVLSPSHRGPSRWPLVVPHRQSDSPVAEAQPASRVSTQGRGGGGDCDGSGASTVSFGSLQWRPWGRSRGLLSVPR